MYLVGCICVHCCNVFSKWCICTVNVVLSFIDASLQYSHFATFDALGFVGGYCTYGQIDAMLRVVCFVGRVFDMWKGGEYNTAGRLQMSRVSWCEKWSEVKVALVFFDVTEGIFSAEMLENDWFNIRIKLDVHLTDDSSDCSLTGSKDCSGKRLNKVLGVLFLFRGVWPQSPLKKKN